MKRAIGIRSKTVLVFHTSLRSSWTDMLRGLYRFSHAQGWNLQVIEHEPDRKSIEDLLDFWHPDGVIVEGAMDEQGVFLSDVFDGVPIVYLLCDQHQLPLHALRVNHDADSLGRVAAREFLSIGLKSFAFFGFTGLFWSEERARCFRAALALNGYGMDAFTRRFFESGKKDVGTDFRDDFMQWLKALPKPCGLLAANDLLACEAVNMCRTAGIRIPDEISILGIDNDEMACENSVPTLSSIRPNFEEAGRLCAQLLDERMGCRGRFKGSPARFFTAAGVVRRQSTRRLPRANGDVSKAMEIIRLRACDGLRPRDVFQELECSRRLAEMRFRELTGHSVVEEIRSVRLEQAKKLLRQGTVPVGEIAGLCGWKSPAQFRACFVAEEGLSPNEWRVSQNRRN